MVLWYQQYLGAISNRGSRLGRVLGGVRRLRLVRHRRCALAILLIYLNFENNQ